MNCGRRDVRCRNARGRSAPSDPGFVGRKRLGRREGAEHGSEAGMSKQSLATLATNRESAEASRPLARPGAAELHRVLGINGPLLVHDATVEK
jgi:hypothetical protein